MSNEKSRIRAFPLTLSEEYADQIVQEIMEAVRDTLEAGKFKGNAEELYRKAYTLVLHKNGQKLYSALKEVLETFCDQQIRNLLSNESSVCDDLDPIVNCWEKYWNVLPLIRDIFMYMDRVYVSQNGVANVVQLGKDTFRSKIILHPKLKGKIEKYVTGLSKQEGIVGLLKELEVTPAMLNM